MPRKLSIVIPAFNEERTLAALVARVEAADLGAIKKEIIVVDDGSTDSTPRIIAGMGARVIAARLPANAGKGAAVRAGYARATGDYIVVQDADLEYDPRDLKRMVQRAAESNAAVIFGSRRLPLEGQKETRGAWYFYAGGVLLTWFTNLLYGTRLTDEPTCYKMVRSDVLKTLELKANGFEFCPELTACIARRGIPIIEVPITYRPRSVAEGKKIRPRDGLIAVWTLLKHRF
jgi:dolichol-phosphate mannosyltransferase